MRVAVVRDKGVIERLVLTAEDSTSPMMRGNILYLFDGDGCRLILPGVERTFDGMRFFLSYGRDVDGGPARLRGACKPSIYAALVRELSKRYAGAVLTLRPWARTHRMLLEYLEAESTASIGSYLYPRILVIPRSFEKYFSSISKKARNRYRYFMRHGGRVVETDPLRHVAEILAINHSSPVRQGRPLPRDYLDPRLVARSAAGWARLRSMGASSFYMAFVEDRAVGYAYIPHLNGHAYASRFLVHSAYMRLGAGNALLIEIVRDLLVKGKARLFQYGYWRNVNPGINKFLAQHGFKAASEPLVFIGRWKSLLSLLYGEWVDLTNRVPRSRLVWLWQIASGRAR